MHPLPSVAKAYSFVLQEEKQREVSTLDHTIPDATALDSSIKSKDLAPA